MIKLVLLDPENGVYRRVLDDLLTLYRDAKRAASDGRLSDQGRQKRVAELEDQLCKICHPHWPPTNPRLQPTTSDIQSAFRNLMEELMRLMMAEQLFEFVLNDAVDSTNNLSERQLRNSALARNANRTNKTDAGARRQTKNCERARVIPPNADQLQHPNGRRTSYRFSAQRHAHIPRHRTASPSQRLIDVAATHTPRRC